jgi:hypothetical protein
MNPRPGAQARPAQLVRQGTGSRPRPVRASSVMISTPSRRLRLPRRLALAAVVLLALSACSRGGGGDGPAMDSREFRAISGVSMGGYGALNLGTRHRDRFGAIGSLGGPVDLRQLLADIRDQNLEVKRLMGIPMDVNADDFSFDLLPAYPARDARISFTKDLVLAFGNPTLHHPDPDFAYRAIDSEPAAIGMDDVWGSFTAPSDFVDGGDDNEDGLRQIGEVPSEPADPLLVAGGTLLSVFGESGTDVGGRMLADTDSDMVYDLGDGIVVNMNEPFDDANANGVRDAGEIFDDFGLDGVAGTLDFGEGNGVFDEDPDIATWLAEDPLARIEDEYSPDTIRGQRIYMDVGTRDELGFLAHYDHLVSVIESKGVNVVEIDGFDGGFGGCLDIPNVDDPYVLLRYDGNHIGFDEAGLRDDLRSFDLDVCDRLPIWQRLLHLLVAMDAAFADGFDGPGGLRLTGGTLTRNIVSPALAPPMGAAPLRTVVVYRPPAYFNTDRTFPILYFLGGHGQSPEDYEQVGLLLDLLIDAGLIQNMFVAFLPGEGGTEGSFYVNHVVSESQVPGLAPVTSGRYEDSIIDDLIPAIEQDLLAGRVR